jgi:uncharacterized protein
MRLLAEREKKTLLHLARYSLTEEVRSPGSHFSVDAVSPTGSLSRAGGAFVTIFRKGRLRGCIGQMPSETALLDVVAHCARSVASEDPRFPRVRPEELAEIEIELSVLSDLIDIGPEQIEPGRHGLLVSNGSHKGVLLPQVATQFHWNGVRFLEATCEKAGLSKNAWKDARTQVRAFTAEVFNEAEFRDYSSST